LSRFLSIPIKVELIAERLGADPDIVFSRLNFHLKSKYSYRQDDGILVPFFEVNFQDERHVINFPHAASALAHLRDERGRFNWTRGIAFLSLVVSMFALYVSFQKLGPCP
jgi:hypothetical protein